MRIGETATFTCSAIGGIIWTHNNKSLPSNAKYFNKTLEIEKVRLNNKGVYECEGVEENNHIFYSIGTLKIKGRYNKIRI